MKRKRLARAEILLKACYDILKKCEQSHYVLDACSQTAFYDGTDCDGYCLMEDIAVELGIEE
jgi:hypothetical protein